MDLKLIEQIVNEGANLSKQLECDGSTRVLNYLLNKRKIAHTVMMGTASYNGTHLPLHYWIKIGRYIIDNKSRMYFGDSIPEGVFESSPVRYTGDPVQMDTSDAVFDALTFDTSKYMEEFLKLQKQASGK